MPDTASDEPRTLLARPPPPPPPTTASIRSSINTAIVSPWHAIVGLLPLPPMQHAHPFVHLPQHATAHNVSKGRNSDDTTSDCTCTFLRALHTLAHLTHASSASQTACRICQRAKSTGQSVQRHWCLCGWLSPPIVPETKNDNDQNIRAIANSQ